MAVFKELPDTLKPVHDVATELDAFCEKLERDGYEAGDGKQLAKRLHAWLDGQANYTEDVHGEA